MQQTEGRQDHRTHVRQHWPTAGQHTGSRASFAGDSLAALIHDTRNMVASMELYCDLLDEPGVLAAEYRHYAGELRLVSGASRRLLERLSMLNHSGNGNGVTVSRADAGGTSFAVESDPFVAFQAEYPPLTRPGRQRLTPANPPVCNLADELQANRNLLSALAGPGIAVALSLPDSASAALCTIAMTADNLTRILINLARNAASAMPAGGRIQIDLVKQSNSLELTFSDTGPGIPETVLETIFSPGYSTKTSSGSEFSEVAGSSALHGLGLAIVRALVQGAGGSVYAVNRVPDRESAAPSGAAIVIRFPLQT